MLEWGHGGKKIDIMGKGKTEEKEDIRVREREEGEIWTLDWGEGGAL